MKAAPQMRWGPRGSQFVRQWRLLVLLRSQPRTLEWLAEELRATTRTVRRDLAVLETAGIPIRKWGKDTDEEWMSGMPSLWFVGAMREWPTRQATPTEMLQRN